MKRYTCRLALRLKPSPLRVMIGSVSSLRLRRCRRVSGKSLSLGSSKAVPTRRLPRSRRFPLAQSCLRSRVPAASCIPLWQIPLRKGLPVKCDFADSLLQGYFDGELGDRRAAEFERHLGHCDHCATELVELDWLSGRLQLTPIYEPAPASLRRKINTHLHPIAPTRAASQPLLWQWLTAPAPPLFLPLVLRRASPEPPPPHHPAQL